MRDPNARPPCPQCGHPLRVLIANNIDPAKRVPTGQCECTGCGIHVPDPGPWKPAPGPTLPHAVRAVT